MIKRHLNLIILLIAMPAASQSFDAWTAKAEKAQKNGDAEIAAEYWTNALRVWRKTDGKPKRAKALSARASLYERNGEVDGALADLNMALKLDPKNATLFFRRGQILADQGKLAEAISDYYSATTLKITYADAYMQRGLAYEKQGDAKFAKEDFTVACRYGVDDACIRIGKRPKGGKKKAKAAEEPEALEPADAASARAATAEPDEDAPEVKAVRTKKAKPAPDAKAPAAQAAAKPAAPKPAAPAKPKVKPIDFAACTAAIEACSEDGTALDICVRQAKPCDDKSVRGCCPITCQREFERHSGGDVSSAALFRELFTEKHPCVQGKATN